MAPSRRSSTAAAPLGGSKQRSVVAMLALHANRTLSGDELIDGLWGDDPPASAAKNVQLYVSRLRKALADERRGGRDPHPRARLRAPAPRRRRSTRLRFERLVEEAAREPAERARRTAPPAPRSSSGAAPRSPTSPHEPFAAPEIRRLEELHLRALELAIDAELAAGRHDEVIARLEALIAEEPLRERLHAQRMLALYRAGRQSDALDAYREARETLIEQIGVEPGPELQRLQAAILAQDPSLDAAAADRRAAGPARGRLAAARRARARAGWLRRRWERGARGAGRLRARLGACRDRQDAARRRARGRGPGRRSGGPLRRRRRGRRGRAGDRRRGREGPATDAAGARLRRRRAAGGARGRRRRSRASPREPPLLICVLHHDEQGPPAFAGLLDAGAAERLRLDPLGEDATAEIAALYAPAEGVAMPLRTLIAESEGVPLRVHRAAGEWARAEAAERLAATAGAGRRRSRRAARGRRPAIAGGVVDLQAASERTRALRGRGAARIPSEPEICPFRGLAPFDAAHAEYFFGRERLVAELVARLVGSTLLAVVGPSGQRQVLGGARGPPAGARRRGRARLGALAPGGDAPGRAPARRALADARARGAGGGARGRRAVDRRRARAGCPPASAWCSSSTSSRRSSSPAATRPSARRSSMRWSRAPPTRTSA